MPNILQHKHAGLGYFINIMLCDVKKQNWNERKLQNLSATDSEIKSRPILYLKI